MADDEEPRRRMVKPPTGGAASGRGVGHTSVKTASDRSMSSQLWLQRQLNDPYVTRAKAEGWRSRAAFKLIEVDDRFHLVKRGGRVIDLGCAPGGWVQVALKRGAAKVAGVDLLHVDPIPGSDLVVGDFNDPDMPGRLLDLIGGPPDLILSDMAPNTSGHRETDHLRIVNLIESAAAFARAHLKPGGHFMTKTFQGGAEGELLRQLKADYAEVKHMKPKSSRQESSEVYLVGIGFRGQSSPNNAS